MLLTVEMWGGKRKQKLHTMKENFLIRTGYALEKSGLFPFLFSKNAIKILKKSLYIFCTVISTVINYPFFFLVFWVILTFLINRFYIWIGNVLCKQTRIVFTIDVCIVKDIIIHFTGFMSMLVLDQWSHYQNRNN